MLVIVPYNRTAEPIVEEDRLRSGFAQPGEEKAEGDVIALFSFLVGGYGEDADRVFSGRHNGKTKGNAHKNQQRKSCLERKKNYSH